MDHPPAHEPADGPLQDHEYRVHLAGPVARVIGCVAANL
jgi:hypothetical protein